MQNDVTQVFYFHADANSVGGYLVDPSKHEGKLEYDESSFRYVHTPCSVALSSTGGSVSSESKHYAFEDKVSIRRAYTHVSGRPRKMNGPWIQRVVSVVEGVSILSGKITAEKITAQMFIEQPADNPKLGKPDFRRISFAGSHYVDFRIDGKQITPTLDSTLLPSSHSTAPAFHENDVYNRIAPPTPLDWPELTRYANERGIQRAAQLKGAPAWVQARLGWVGDTNNPGTNTAGYTLCSLVDQVQNVPTPGQSYAHAIELPDVGRLFLGEVTIFPRSVHLTMFRAELGCNTSGQMSVASGGFNGTSMPPSASGN